MPKSVPLPDYEDPARRPILIPPRVWDELDSYEKNLQSKFIKAFRLISKDLAHPSLHIEVVRIKGAALYRARVDAQFRVHFELSGNFYAVVAVGPHHLQGIG